MLFVTTQKLTQSIPIPDNAHVYVRRINNNCFGVDVVLTPWADREDSKDTQLGWYETRDKAISVLCKLSEARCAERGHFVMPQQD